MTIQRLLASTAIALPCCSQHTASARSRILVGIVPPRISGEIRRRAGPDRAIANRQPVNNSPSCAALAAALQGKYAEAEKRYLRAAEVNPRSIEAKLGLMLPQMALYRWNDAIQSGGVLPTARGTARPMSAS